MKRFFLFAAILVATCTSAGAQTAQNSPLDREKSVFASDISMVRPGMKYRELKEFYDKTDYTYLSNPEYSTNRAWLNVAYPGIAQMTMGEGGLGAIYVGWALVGEVIFTTGLGLDRNNGSVGFGHATIPTKSAVLLAGSAIYLSAAVFSIINAVNIAKIKSLHAADMNNIKNNYSFSVTPTIIPSYSLSGVEFTPGIGMTLSF